LLVAGPRIRRGDTLTTPSANSDIAPTILALLELPPAPSMTGRILREVWSKQPAAVRRTVATTGTTLPDGSRYDVTLYGSIVGATRYLDSTRVERSGPR
jgi:arylsulfatase A-like enzyme